MYIVTLSEHLCTLKGAFRVCYLKLNQCIAYVLICPSLIGKYCLIMHHVQSSIDVSCHKADVDCIYIQRLLRKKSMYV